MKLINNINSQRFSYNGVEYFKNFISKVIGNTITVYNAYDSRDVLFENELYSNIQINGIVYGSAVLTQSNLLSVIYTRDSLNGIVQTSGYFNRFTNATSFSLVGQNLIIVAGWAWEIQGFPYSKEDQTTINIPYATTGKHRIDVVLADTNNNFYLVQGQEVLLANSPAEPAPVPNTLKLTSILVNASGYGTPTDPDTATFPDNTASHFKGGWNATTNTPTLVNGVGQVGDHYICSNSGSVDFGDGIIQFFVNDVVCYNSFTSKWFKFIDNNQTGGSPTLDYQEIQFNLLAGESNSNIGNGLTVKQVIVGNSYDLIQGTGYTYNSSNGEFDITDTNILPLTETTTIRVRSF